jgi:hypothetical protein
MKYAIGTYDQRDFSLLVMTSKQERLIDESNVGLGHLSGILEDLDTRGWKLITTFPSAHVGSNRAIPGRRQLVTIMSANEEIAFIFRKQ